MDTKKLIGNLSNVKEAVNKGTADSEKVVNAVLSACLVLCRKVDELEYRSGLMKSKITTLELKGTADSYKSGGDIFDSFGDIFGGKK